MKLLNFKTLIILLLILLNSNVAKSEGTINKEDSKRSYDRRVERYKDGFSSLAPSFTCIHLYGDVGLISLGLGWDYGRRDQWETSLMFGIIPKFNSEEAKITFTMRQRYIPWSIPIRRCFSIEPLTCGLQINTVLNKEFWVKEPDKYPSSYYGFSTKIRGMVFLGQSITYDIPEHKRHRNRAISLYYDVGTCELYIISAFTNQHLKPKDFLRFAFGMKFQIF